MVKKKAVTKRVLKAIVVIVCVTGFMLQTLEFYVLYRTFPTVVDIQVSVPSEIEVPGITICNAIGVTPESVCKLGGRCIKGLVFQFVDICYVFDNFCTNGTLPPDVTAIRYTEFMRKNELNATALELLRVPLKDFFKCKITSGSDERECDTENVVYGSYYSDTNMPSFCFTINSKWGDPSRKIQRMKKSEKIKMEFYLDTSYRNRSAPPDLIQMPKYNTMSSSSVQIAIHSQLFSPSPFVSGKGFLGGKRYLIKLTKEEKHLLPPPYQTNCTDYMKEWKSKGGVGPLNQVMAIQECRMKAAVEEIGCVPYFIDFPHNETVCKYCPDCENMTRVGRYCTDLLQSSNQPCDSASFHMNVDEQWVYIYKTIKSTFISSEESFVIRQKGYDCLNQKMFSRQCQTVNIELDFDEYEVTNMTYNPKFESLELFSVIGGYMGMYLGISLVAVYDFFETALGVAFKFMKKPKNTKIRKMQKKLQNSSKEQMANFQYPTEFRKRPAMKFSSRDNY